MTRLHLALAALPPAALPPAPARGQGAAYAAGYNSQGQLGNGTTTSSSTPVAVTGLGSGVTAVSYNPGGSVSNAFGLAVRNGAAFTWGNNSNGQLGNNSTTNSSTPVAVSSLNSGVTAVSAGFTYSLAVQNGAAYGWGANAQGQLGNGTTTSSSTPVAVTGLGSGVTAVSAGGDNSNSFSLAVRNGAAYAWGYNSVGELGNGTNTPGASNPNPAVVSGLGSGVTAVSAGLGHGLAVQSGAAYAWGFNSKGQLGNNTTTNTATPSQVGGLLAGLTVEQVAAGYNTSYALTSTHRLFAWGDNSQGQYGNSTTTSSLVPVEVFAPSGLQFSSVSGGSYSVSFILTPVPEPATCGLLAAAGLGAVGFVRRRLTRS